MDKVKQDAEFLPSWEPLKVRAIYQEQRPGSLAENELVILYVLGGHFSFLKSNMRGRILGCFPNQAYWLEDQSSVHVLGLSLV